MLLILCLLSEVGVKEMQHGSAVLATIESNTHIIKPVPMVCLLHCGERVLYLATHRGRKEGSYATREMGQ